MKLLQSQSSANMMPELTLWEQSCLAVLEVSSIQVSAAAPPQTNAAARRSAIADFVDLNKCFMIISPFLFEVMIRIADFRQITMVLLRKCT